MQQHIDTATHRSIVTRAIGAVLLALGLSWSTFGQDARPQTTILIVARANLPDDHFRDSVVLVMNNIRPAPVGVIVNRPTRIPVSHLFPDVERLAQLDDKLYFGGPVDITSVLFIFRAATPPDDATRVLDDLYISMNRDLLRRLLARDKPMEDLRIFVGHAGWAPGQLEAEIARGDWTLAPADPSAVFDAKPLHPWPGERAPGGRRI